MSLRGKTALVTRSTSGMGLAIADDLARAGANVVLHGPGDAEGAMQLVADAGGRVGHHSADLRKPDEIADMIRYAEQAFGGIDILVNNTGLKQVAPAQVWIADPWDEVLAANLSSVFHTMQLALPKMKAKKWGRIINIAAMAGHFAASNEAAYEAAKHGIIGLTRSIAQETAGSPVTCHAICPDLADASAPPAAPATEDGNVTAVGGQSRGPELPAAGASPTQIARLVLFLCSDAAIQVRGAAWNKDGGWLA
jgi:3-hydroxybutyrate dehydrogenase